MIINEEQITKLGTDTEDEIYNERPIPQALYHYTNSAGFYGIVESFSLRMTHTAYLNDASEITYSKDLAKLVASEFFEENKVSALDQFIKHIDQRDTIITTAITCFSDSDNLLNQWRDYGGQQAYCLGFDVRGLIQSSSLPVRLLPMVYNPDDQRLYARSYMRKWLDYINSDEFQRAAQGRSLDDAQETLLHMAWNLLRICTFFKHQSFAVEREWRLVWEGVNHNTMWNFTPSMYGLTPSRMRTFDLGGRLPLSSLTVGPCRFPDQAQHSAALWLDQKGYQVPIKYSFIPLRN